MATDERRKLPGAGAGRRRRRWSRRSRVIGHTPCKPPLTGHIKAKTNNPRSLPRAIRIRTTRFGSCTPRSSRLVAASGRDLFPRLLVVLIGFAKYRMLVTRSSSFFLAMCIGTQIIACSAVHISTMPTHAPLFPLRGGGEPLRRQLSHENLKAELHGAPDTADARVYAKDTEENEHRSLWHDLPLFEVDPKDNKPTGALNFVCEIPKWTR